MMKYLLMTCLLLFVSCSKQSDIDDVQVTGWSESGSVTERRISATHSLPFRGGDWIVISTSYQEESAIGVTYDGGEVLKSGFLVYPGGKKVADIGEALVEAKRIEASW